MENEEGKPTLKVSTETVHRVNYNDLDRFLSDVYGVNYEFVAMEGMSNDTSKEYDIKKEPLDEYDQKRIAEMQAKGYRHFVTRTLLVDCCNRGLIPEGRYVINISWQRSRQGRRLLLCHLGATPQHQYIFEFLHTISTWMQASALKEARCPRR